jgi:hypothetical protein
MLDLLRFQHSILWTQELEEQLSTLSKKNRDDLAEERAELEQQRAALSQEVNMNTVETPESQLFYMQSFKVCS